MARMANHLAPQGGGYEPQRKFDFEVLLYGVPGQEVLKLACESFDPPGATNPQIELGYLNEVIKVAGQGSWSNASLVVRDMVDQQVMKNVYDWKKMVHDPANGNIGLASSYKKQGELILIGPDGSGEKKYKLKGVWPTEVKGDQVAYTAGTEVFKLTLTLSVDKAEMA